MEQIAIQHIRLPLVRGQDPYDCFVLSDYSTAMSFKSFARSAGFKSPHSLKNYLEGKRIQPFVSKKIAEGKIPYRGPMKIFKAKINAPSAWRGQTIEMVSSSVCELFYSAYTSAILEDKLAHNQRHVGAQCYIITGHLEGRPLHHIIAEAGGYNPMISLYNQCKFSPKHFPHQRSLIVEAFSMAYPGRPQEQYDNNFATVLNYAYNYVMGKNNVKEIKTRKANEDLICEHFSSDMNEKIRIYLAMYTVILIQNAKEFRNKYQEEKESMARPTFSPIRTARDMTEAELGKTKFLDHLDYRAGF